MANSSHHQHRLRDPPAIDAEGRLWRTPRARQSWTLWLRKFWYDKFSGFRKKPEESKMEPLLSVLDEHLPLERDMFLRLLLRELAGTLQDVVGLEEASGYISVVGAAMGDQIDTAYRESIKVERLNRQQVSAVLVDLKRRIQGDFYIIEEREDRIVLGNRACPFGTFVRGRPSLCMMTSNVFGSIAAQNLGYARVAIEESIAAGHSGCRVVVDLRPNEKLVQNAREYFRREE